MAGHITITFFTFCLACAFVNVRGASDFWQSETNLRKQMFRDYDKTVRPSLNVSVVVRNLQVEGMEVREDAHSLLLHGSLQLTWEDPRLRWRLEDHEDMDRLGVDPQELWRPDLNMYSSPQSNSIAPPHTKTPALVYPDGVVLFVPPVDLSLTCLLDLTYWPYDVLNCSLKAGTWVHHGHMLNLTLDEDPITFPLTEGEVQGSAGVGGSTSTEWEVLLANLTRYTHHLACCSEPQVALLVTVVVRRVAPAITWLLKTPLLCMCVMTCLVFLLPVKGGEKAVFGSVCVLINMLFLGFATTIVYKDPMHTPLIVQLVMHQVVLTVVSVVVAVVVVRLATAHHSYPLPRTLNKILAVICPLLCLSSCCRRNPKGSHQPEYAVIVKSDQIELGEGSTAEGVQGSCPEGLSQWVLLANVINRLAFVLYLTACIVTLIRFSPVL